MPSKSGILTQSTYLIYKIEMIQRWAARWVLLDYNYHSRVLTMLNNLGWISLEEWHSRSRIQLYKILNGFTPGVQLPSNYLPWTTTTRQSHPLCFILPATRTISYQTNFFYHTVSDWNNLPTTFYNITTLDLFTHTLNTYM